MSKAPTYSIREQTRPPKSPKSPASRLSYGVWLAIALVLLVGSSIIAHKHQLSGLQLRFFYDVNNLPNHFTELGKIITEVLGAAYPIIACAIIPLFFKKFYLGWRFLVSSVGAVVLAEIIKKIVSEPRPVVLLHGHLHQRVVETGAGFPSGHEAVATALALTLWLILPARWRWLSIVWIAAVAWSRLYLGVHTPADIIGGFACGLLAVCVVHVLPKVIAKPLRLLNDQLLKTGF